jgi:AAA15 family ATPase/GTPase
MIVEFSVKNFRSIKELQTLSFVATGLKSDKDNLSVDTNNVAEDCGMRLLKTIGIYGGNASGKSNVVKALEYFLGVIKKEASSESNFDTICDPFLYQEDSYFSESFFQIVLIIKDKKYRYGFTVKKNMAVKNSADDPDKIFSKEIVTGEWLFGTKEKNMVEYFTRTGMSVRKEKHIEGGKIPQLPYEHTLFLTHAAAFDSEGDCAIIKNYIHGWILSNFIKEQDRFRRSSIILIKNETKKYEFLKLLSAFSIDYDDITIEKNTNQPDQTSFPYDKFIMKKSFYDKDNKSVSVSLNLGYNESAGTQKLFDLAGVILRAFEMPYSAFIVIDELDSNFHPSLLIKLIGLFNNPKINKSKSQLLFTSHDTNLLAPSIMRRDQFYFTEKSEDNATRLYSLADLKGIKNDADFAKQYLSGFYGAIPRLESLINENIE